MNSDSAFVSSIYKLCQDRSEKRPKIICDACTCWWNDANVRTIINFYDDSVLPLLESITDENPPLSDLNAALQISCKTGDVFVTDFLLEKGADPNSFLNSDCFFDFQFLSIAATLLRKTDKSSYYVYIKENFDTDFTWYRESLSRLEELIMIYANIRNYEFKNSRSPILLQDCKRQREDIVFLFSEIHGVLHNPLLGFCIPGDFRFVSPISFHNMLKDSGDGTDSKFARRVLSLLEPGTPIFEY